MHTCINGSRYSHFSRIVFLLLAATLLFIGCSDDDGGGSTIITYYQDSDGDYYGNPDVFVKVASAEERPDDYVRNGTDCDDTNENIHSCCFDGERFTDMGDGTIRDNQSGLIWLKNAGAFLEIAWEDAKEAAATLSSGEYGLTDNSVDGDWRLPTREEWEDFMCLDFPVAIGERSYALVNAASDGQWEEGDAFTEVQRHYYWACDEYDEVKAWTAFMGRGGTYPSFKSYTKYYNAWPVREGN